ncbi:Antitoxin MqsA [compost metagenome]
MNKSTCPICLEGTLIPKRFSGTLAHKNIKIRTSLFEHSVCDTCESEVASAEQMKHNKMLSIEFQRAAEGFLPPSEIFRIRKKLKLNIRDASSIIGGGGIAFSKYENGATKQSTAVDNLLRLLDAQPDLLSTLRALQAQRAACEHVQAELFFEPTDQRTEDPQPGFFSKLLEPTPSAPQFKPATAIKKRTALTTLFNLRPAYE